MKPTILFADDQRRIREYCQQELGSAGFRVMTVEDGDDALDVLESVFVDLVILDEHMPRTSGREVARAIRQSHPGLPVILFTADPLYERYQSAWIDATVAKSEDLAPLVVEMTTLLAAAGDEANTTDELTFPNAPDASSPSLASVSRGRRPTYA